MAGRTSVERTNFAAFVYIRTRPPQNLSASVQLISSRLARGDHSNVIKHLCDRKFSLVEHHFD